MIGRTNVGGGSSAPSYSIHGWCATVGLSYALLSDISEADMRTLMTKYASVAYFLEWYSNEPSMIDDFIANSYAMKWIGLRDYICDQLMALQSVRTKMLASANWGYILKDHVPTMTSDTAPYGECRAISSYTTYLPYKAFDKSASTTWLSNQDGVRHATNIWIEYKFSNPICARKFYIRFESSVSTMQYKIQGSNDGTNYVDITETRNTVTNGYQDMTNDSYYMIYRLFIIDETTTSSPPGRIIELDFYGRSLNVSVPKMTSNTAPYGEAFANNTYSTTYYAYQAFASSGGWVSKDNTYPNHVGYHFVHPICVRKVSMRLWGTTNIPKTMNVQASNDNSTWTTISNYVNTVQTSGTDISWDINNNDSYLYYRLQIVDGYGTRNEVRMLQFYGIDYSERTDRTYLYDHGIKLVPMSIGIDDGLDALGTITENANSVTSDCPSSTKDHAPYFTNSTIDITPYSHACAIFETVRYLSGVESGFARLRIGTTRGFASSTGSKGNRDVNMNTNASQNLSVLDVSNINESCYFGFGAVLLSDAGQYCTVDIYELWLE